MFIQRVVSLRILSVIKIITGRPFYLISKELFSINDLSILIECPRKAILSAPSESLGYMFVLGSDTCMVNFIHQNYLPFSLL